jgi:hypothetical protein
MSTEAITLRRETVSARIYEALIDVTHSEREWAELESYSKKFLRIGSGMNIERAYPVPTDGVDPWMGSERSPYARYNKYPATNTRATNSSSPYGESRSSLE